MVSSPILWSGRYGCDKNQKFFLDSENPVSRRLPSRYQVNYPPDSWEVLFNVSTLSHTLHRWSAVGELRVSDQRCLACTAGAEKAKKLLPPQSEGQQSPVRQRLRPRTPLKSRLSCLVSMVRSRFMLGWLTRPSQIRVV